MGIGSDKKKKIDNHEAITCRCRRSEKEAMTAVVLILFPFIIFSAGGCAAVIRKLNITQSTNVLARRKTDEY